MANTILKEAFDSVPYEVSYEVKPPAAEWYNFEEDSTHQYRIEVNSPTQAKAGKLGKNVKVVRIGFKSSGTNFRPVIGKFKDAKKVIATVLDILNKYKTEGKYGNKIQGFALQFKASSFGPYANLVKRIARMYLRQQFKVSESDWTPNEDQSYVWIVRKGKKFSDVFNGEDVVSAGINLDGDVAGGEVHTPTDSNPTPDTANKAAEEAQKAKYKVGDIVARPNGPQYYQIIGMGSQDGNAYYTVNGYKTSDGSMIASSVNISVAAADIVLVPYTPSASPESTANNRMFADGEMLLVKNYGGTDDEVYAAQVLGFDNVAKEYEIQQYNVYKQPVGSPMKGSLSEIVALFDQGTPEFKTPATHKFKAGDKLHVPGTTFYSVIQRTATTTSGEPAYYVRFYRKSDNSDLGGGIEHFQKEESIVETGVVRYEPEAEQSTAQEGTVTPKFKIGDFIHSDNTSLYYLKVTDFGNGGNGTEYKYTVDVFTKHDREPHNRGGKFSVNTIESSYKKYNPKIANEDAKFKEGQWFYERELKTHSKIVGVNDNKYSIFFYEDGDFSKPSDKVRWSILLVDSDYENILGQKVEDPTTSTTQTVATTGNAYTKEEQQKAILSAAAKYDVVIDGRESLVNALMKYCPHISVNEICEAFFAAGGSSGIRKIKASSSGVIDIEQTGGEMFGAPLSYMSRKISLQGGYAYHDYLKMAPSSQGGGATKELFRRTMPLFESMGLKKVKVYANIQVGAAIWSKYGFKDASGEAKFRGALNQHLSRINLLKKDLLKLPASAGYSDIHEREIDGIISILEGLKNKDYFSDWPAYICSLTCPNVEADFQEQIKWQCAEASETVDVSIGKFLNWGLGYDGELVFSDKQSYNRMAKYTGLPRKE